MPTRLAKRMYVIIWQYQVKPERATEFEGIYNSNGRWAQLLKKGKGFLDTELMRGEEEPYRYLTIDRWESLQAYESFLRKWRAEYAELDAQCEELTKQESLVGRWELIPPET